MEVRTVCDAAGNVPLRCPGHLGRVSDSSVLLRRRMVLFYIWLRPEPSARVPDTLCGVLSLFLSSGGLGIKHFTSYIPRLFDDKMIWVGKIIIKR